MQRIKITASITIKEPILDKYFREIDKLKLLSPEEEVHLSELIKKGDKAALDRLTKANLRFVVSIAKKYQGQGLSLPDLINEGNYGLIVAAHRYDPSRGFRFISYAIWHIRQHILIALAEHARLIKLPIKKIALSSRIYKSFCSMEQQLERAPSAEELAEILNIDAEDVNRFLSLRNQHVSLDTPLNEDEETGSLLDILKNQDEDKTETELYHKASLKTELKRLFGELSERQQEVLCWFFGIGMAYPMSLDDIAVKLYLTPERVRQIKDKAIERLRSTESINLLRSFLAA
jgi:RNA polymerase primary sigma factor